LLQADGGGVTPAGNDIPLDIPASDTQVIDDAIQKLLVQDADLPVRTGDLPVLRA
jgi:hypothetical protein